MNALDDLMDKKKPKTMAKGMEEDVNPMEKEMSPQDRGMSDEGGGDEEEGMKAMKIAVPAGVRAFDDAMSGEEVPMKVMMRKMDGNYGEIVSIEGHKVGGDEEGDTGEGDDPNEKPGMNFLDMLGETGDEEDK